MSTRNSTLLLTLAALAAPALARAEGAGLKHEKSIYADDREAPLKTPEGVACDDRGALVVADTGNGRLLTFTWTDGTLKGGAQTKLTQLTHPVRVQIDGAGNVLALDRKSRRIVRVDAKGAFGGVVELSNALAPAPVPVAFRVDAAGGLYVIDVAGGRVLVAAPSGKVAREIALPRPGEFTDLAIDPAGRVYALDAVGGSLWVAEKGASTFTALTKSLRERASFPASLTFARGKLFVVDQNGMGVVVVGQDGSFQGRELGLGWTEGLVYYPGQICVNERGETFLADRQNNRVQIFASTR